MDGKYLSRSELTLNDIMKLCTNLKLYIIMISTVIYPIMNCSSATVLATMEDSYLTKVVDM